VTNFLEIPRERAHAEAVVELDEAFRPVGVVHVACRDAFVGQARRVTLHRTGDALPPRGVHEMRSAVVVA